MQMIKLKDLLYEKKLTSDDIKVGDAYLKKTRQGKIVSMVYEKKYNGGVITVEYDFKPSYGDPMFMGVGSSGSAESVNSWGRDKKIKVTSKMKKMMEKTLNDAINSKYNGSEETDVLLRNRDMVGSLYNVLAWVGKI